MSTFTWPENSPNVVTFVVSEMSRAAALSCARDFNVILAAQIYKDDGPLLQELEALAAIYAPTIIKLPDGRVVREYSFEHDGTAIELKLPLSREIFDKLPYSLTTGLITAAINANDWVVQDLKNAYRRIAQQIGGSPSGNEQSSAQTETFEMTKTTGMSNTPIGT